MKRTAVRELLKVTSQPEIISFAGGLPAAELFPVARVGQALEAVLERAGGRCLQYAETEGIAPLRDWLARRFSHRGRPLRREQVLITSGGQQALDLLGRVFLEEGDRVVVENPTYLALLSAWRPFGVQFLGAPSDRDGLVVEKLQPLLEAQPKLMYLVPNFQNPQGTTLAGHRRQALSELLGEYGLPLVEDDPYGELRYEGKPLPHLFELNENVILVGTFSKTLFPGLRIGWVIAAPEVVDKLVQAKQAADLHSCTLSQYLAWELLQQGFLEEFLPILRQQYRARRDCMLDALAKYFPPGFTWPRPEGGMFLMVTLPRNLDATQMLAEALKRKVAFVPGEEFHLNGEGRNTLRLNFSNATPEQIETGIKRLGQVFREAMG